MASLGTGDKLLSSTLTHYIDTIIGGNGYFARSWHSLCYYAAFYGQSQRPIGWLVDALKIIYYKSYVKDGHVPQANFLEGLKAL